MQSESDTNAFFFYLAFLFKTLAVSLNKSFTIHTCWSNRSFHVTIFRTEAVTRWRYTVNQE